MKVWTRDIESMWSPVLANDTLYIAASDEIHALNPSTGEQRWRVSFDESMIAPLATATPGGSGGDARDVSNAKSSVVIVGVFGKGTAIAFAGDDGRRLWTQALGAPTHFTPVSDGKRIFFALDDSRAVALRIADGTRDWEQKVEGTINQPAVVEDRLLVGTNSNYLYSFDHDSGRLAWRWKAGGDVIGISGGAKGGAYYASLDNVLRAVNGSNGNQRWIKEIPTRPGLPPQTLVGDGKVYTDVVVLTGVTSEVDTFDAKNGTPIGMYMPPSDLEGGPLVDPVLKPYQVAIVVITRDGRAVGLRPSAMMLPEPAIVPFTTDLPGRRLDRERIAR
jgi:outer membrane protein assembly factor BamB